jgi:hypothetical protein
MSLGNRQLNRRSAFTLKKACKPVLEQLEGRQMLSVAVASGVPALSSNSGAAIKLYLDFNGNSAFYWNGGYSGWQFNVPQTPAYDIDGDTATFNDAELTNIRDIWSRVAEKFSPFNVDVTTVQPSSFADKQGMHLIIGGDGAWFPDGSAAAAQRGSFSNTSTQNVAMMFSAKFVGSPKNVAESSAMALGLSMGLINQSAYDSTGRMTSTFSRGNSAIAPVMGSSRYSTRGLWWNGKTYMNSSQDDLAMITSSTNGITYRPDANGNTIGTATAMSGSASGVIERTTDVDYFSFTTAGGSVTINGAVNQYGPMLDLKLSLFNSGGSLIASADTATLGESLSTSLAAGTYYVMVSGHGNVACYDANNVLQGTGADLGQYTLTVSGSTAPAPTTPAAASGLAATAASTSQINLVWNDNSTNETGFEIDRATNSTFTSGLTTATVGSNVESYSATGLAAGTTYYFRVRATNTAGDSSNSNVGSATTNAAVVAPTAPAAANGLAATVASSSQINLVWNDNSSNETGFEIDRATNSTFTSGLASMAVGANAESYSMGGLTAGTTYYFRVRATNGVGDSANTAAVYATTMSAPILLTTPTAASGLTATAASSSQINLAWLDNSSNESGFKIERSTSSTFSTVTTVTVGANVRNYSATGLAAGTTYYFRVKAINTAGTAAASNTASATTTTVTPAITTPAAPTGLKKTRTGKKTTISWVDQSNNESGFRLQYSLDGVNWVSMATLGTNQTSYQTTIKNADGFRYRVQAYNMAGNSAWTVL